jgi:hypothetical protein
MCKDEYFVLSNEQSFLSMEVDIFKVRYLIVKSIKNILPIASDYLSNEYIAMIFTDYLDSSVSKLHFYASAIR